MPTETLNNLAGTIASLAALKKTNTEFLKRFSDEHKADRAKTKMDEAKTARDKKKEATKFLSDLNSGFFDAFGELTAAGKQAKQNVETQQKWDKRKEDREEKRWKEELAELRKQKITDKKEQEKRDKKIIEIQEKAAKKLLAQQAKGLGGQKSNNKKASIQSESDRRLAAKAAGLAQSTNESNASSSSTLVRMLEQDQVHHAHRSMMSTILNVAQAKQAIRQHKDYLASQLLFEGMRHMAHQNWVATTGVQKELVRIHSVLVKDTPGAKGQQGQRLSRMSDERAELLKREARLDAKVQELSGSTGTPFLGRHKEFKTMTELNTEVARGNRRAMEIEKEMNSFRLQTGMEARENVKWEKDPNWDGKKKEERFKLDDDGNRIQKYAGINKSAHIPDRIIPPEADGAGGIVEAIEKHAKTINTQSNVRALRNRHATEKWTTDFWERVWEKPDAKTFLLGDVKTQYGMKGDLTKDDGTTSKLISKITKINVDQFKQMQGDPAIAKEFAKSNKIDPDAFVKGLEDGSVYLTASGNIRSKKDIKLQNKVNEMLSTKGSAYTHDTHVEKRMQELIDIFGTTLFRGEGKNTIGGKVRGDIDGSDPGLSWWAEDEGYAKLFANPVGNVKSKKFDMANKSMFNITPIADMEQGFGDLLNPDKHKNIESLNHTPNTAKMFQELLGMDREREDGKHHNSQRGQHLLYGDGGDTAIKYLQELGYDGLSLSGQMGQTHAFFPPKSPETAKAEIDALIKELNDLADTMETFTSTIGGRSKVASLSVPDKKSPEKALEEVLYVVKELDDLAETMASFMSTTHGKSLVASLNFKDSPNKTAEEAKKETLAAMKDLDDLYDTMAGMLGQKPGQDLIASLHVSDEDVRQAMLQGQNEIYDILLNSDEKLGDQLNEDKDKTGILEDNLRISKNDADTRKHMLKLDRKEYRSDREQKHDSFGTAGLETAKNFMNKTNTGSKLTNMMGGAMSLLDKALLVTGGSAGTVTGAMLWKRLKQMMKKPKFLTKMAAWLAKRFGAAGIVAMFSGPVGWLLGALAIGYSIYSLWEMLDEMEKEINEEIAAEASAEATGISPTLTSTNPYAGGTLDGTPFAGGASGGRAFRNSPNKGLLNKFTQDKNNMTDKEFENHYGFPKNGGISSLGMLNNIAYNNLSGQSGGSGGGGNLSVDNSNNSVITTNSSTVISATTAHAPSTPAGMNFSMV